MNKKDSGERMNYYKLLKVPEGITRDQLSIEMQRRTNFLRSIQKRPSVSDEFYQQIETRMADISTYYQKLDDELRKMNHGQKKETISTEQSIDFLDLPVGKTIDFGLDRRTREILDAYQASKTSTRTGKTEKVSPDFASRTMRSLIAISLAALTTIGIAIGKKNASSAENPQTSIVTPVDDSREDVPEEDILFDTEDQITISRIHKAKWGETLWEYSHNSNTSQDTISKINSLNNGKVYYGETMIIPYQISTDDLVYYTQSVSYNSNISLEEFALQYETDADGLKALNPEAITYIGGEYAAISDTLVVPNFITKTELSYAKEETTSMAYQKTNGTSSSGK